mmetsp:Transcript_108261/g.170693  ORF Transcript_108261/g.170693 Transcript_108261/m.170693 type:complete len:280 (+) Transcript_108261:592-1431(+)
MQPLLEQAQVSCSKSLPQLTAVSRGSGARPPRMPSRALEADCIESAPCGAFHQIVLPPSGNVLVNASPRRLPNWLLTTPPRHIAASACTLRVAACRDPLDAAPLSVPWQPCLFREASPRALLGKSSTHCGAPRWYCWLTNARRQEARVWHVREKVHPQAQQSVDGLMQQESPSFVTRFEIRFDRQQRELPPPRYAPFPHVRFLLLSSQPLASTATRDFPNRDAQQLPRNARLLAIFVLRWRHAEHFAGPLCALQTAWPRVIATLAAHGQHNWRWLPLLL